MVKGCFLEEVSSKRVVVNGENSTSKEDGKRACANTRGLERLQPVQTTALSPACLGHRASIKEGTKNQERRMGECWCWCWWSVDHRSSDALLGVWVYPKGLWQHLSSLLPSFCWLNILTNSQHLRVSGLDRSYNSFPHVFTKPQRWVTFTWRGHLSLSSCPLLGRTCSSQRCSCPCAINSDMSPRPCY